MRSINVGFDDFIPKKNIIVKWKKKLPAKKNYLKSKKCDSEGQETFAFTLAYLWVRLFFLSLINN